MTATPPDVSTIDREYVGEPHTLRWVRRDVVDWLNEVRADRETTERAALIASELATNAVQVAPGVLYQLRARAMTRTTAAIAIRSRSAGAVPPPRASWRPVDELAIRGRGLSIVQALSDEVTVETDGDDVVVTASFRIVSAR